MNRFVVLRLSGSKRMTPDSLQSAIHEGPYNYISNWDYSQFVSTLWRPPHAWYPGFGCTDEGPMDETVGPNLISIKIRTEGDIRAAFERVRQEPSKLAVLECCIHPLDISKRLERFSKEFTSKK